MKENANHSIARRIIFPGVVLLVLAGGLIAFRGGNNPKPTITVSLLSEVDLVTNRVATLVLSNAGPGLISIGVWRTNVIDGWLEAYASTGKIDTAVSGFSWTPRSKIRQPGEMVQFIETIPASAERWKFRTDGHDPRRADQIMESPALVKAFGLLDDLPLPDAFWELVRGESQWTLDIQSPRFGETGMPDAEN